MFKKLSAIILSAMIMLYSASFCYAEDQTNLATAGNATVAVNANIEEAYCVSVPTAINLGSNGEAKISIQVKGTLFPNHKLVLSTPEVVTLVEKDSGATNTLTVTISKSEFTSSEVTAEGVGTELNVKGKPLTAGKWAGKFDVSVNLVDIEEDES